jgi:hypothetical protein
VSGLVERAGTGVFEVLWSDTESLPTPAELDAPGLWLARVGVDAGPVDSDLTSLGEVEIPDTLPDDWT